MTGQGYQDEFIFAARLSEPVVDLDDPEAAAAWLTEALGRIVVGRTDGPHLDAAPDRAAARDSRFGLWR